MNEGSEKRQEAGFREWGVLSADEQQEIQRQRSSHEPVIGWWRKNGDKWEMRSDVFLHADLWRENDGVSYNLNPQIGKELYRITPEGEVVLGAGISLSEASLAFWSYVLQHSPIQQLIRDATELDKALSITRWSSTERELIYKRFHDTLAKLPKQQ